MDGGSVNPVPYDLLLDECDVVIAVDVSGARSRDPDDGLPSLVESHNAFHLTDGKPRVHNLRRQAALKLLGRKPGKCARMPHRQLLVL